MTHRKPCSTYTIKGAIRRLENIVASDQFHDATENLLNDPEAPSQAKKDAKEYLKGFGVIVPKQIELTVGPITILTPGDCILVCYRTDSGESICIGYCPARK